MHCWLRLRRHRWILKRTARARCQRCGTWYRPWRHEANRP